MNSENTLLMKDSSGNPAPLGLIAFGMTTVLLNIANSGIYELNSMILAMGIFYGGLAQIFAGLMEWKKNNTFGLTAFVSYGLFWLSLVALIVMPKLGWINETSAAGFVYYFILWGIFTFLMYIGTLRISKALQVVFGTLTILFILLAVADATGSAGIRIIAGIEGIVCGASAIYAGIAQVLNETYGKIVLPLGLVKK